MPQATVQTRVDRSVDNSTAGNGIQKCSDPKMCVFTDLQNYARHYVQQQPENAAMFCLGVGFLLGWKLKPW